MIAERVRILGSDAFDAVGIGDAHERGGREDLIGARGV